MLAVFLIDGDRRGSADETDWADCMACHSEIDSGLPALAPLRPSRNALVTSSSCESCHGGEIPSFFAGDWSHPVRSIGEHIGCESCHPALPHSAEFPPPVPRGDYRAEQCIECHSDTALHSIAFSSHVSNGLTDCIDCHPAHAPLRVLLPDPLLPVSLREDRGSYSMPERSNAPCMDCHPGFDLFSDQREGFVTLNTENYHSLHVRGRGIGCIECHDPHGSNEKYLIRDSLLTGELMVYIPNSQGATCSVSCHGANHNALPYVNRLP